MSHAHAVARVHTHTHTHTHTLGKPCRSVGRRRRSMPPLGLASWRKIKPPKEAVADGARSGRVAEAGAQVEAVRGSRALDGGWSDTTGSN